MTTATQIAHPWRATARTILATALAVILTAATIVPGILPIVIEELAKQGLTLPDAVGRATQLVVAICLALTGIITRVMAVPGVDRLLGYIGLSAAPTAARRAIED